MDKRNAIARSLKKINKYTIKQSILMNIIIEELLKKYYKGELKASKSSDEDISVNEIYNKAIRIYNKGQRSFRYDEQMPICIVDLNENIKKLEAVLELNVEKSSKMKR